MKERIDELVLEKYFINAEEYYIWKNDTYYSVKNQNQLLKVLKEREKELNQYRRKNGLRYKNDPEKYITALIEYYNQH